MTNRRFRFLQNTIMELFDLGSGAAITVLVATAAILLAAIWFFIQSAPPTTLTITTGPEGSVFQKTAARYGKILEKNGVKLKILTSNGSRENLEKLKSGKNVDIGFVQGGLENGESENLVSLGSISQQPILVFYRGSKKMQLISELKRKKIAIGLEGSGANQLAKAILKANGIEEKDASFLPMEAEKASKSLTNKEIDAAFIMSESASFEILRSLMRSKEIKLFSFKQADAYVRKMNYLNRLSLPAGVLDLGTNTPEEEIILIGPTVELLATDRLHPALSDLLLDAATQIHSRPGFYQQRGEFPSAEKHTVELSDDAARYYKSGKSFFYRYLPFWLASLLSRVIVVFLPALVVLIPAVRAIIAFFRWRVRVRVSQRYRELLSLERSLLSEKDPEKKQELRSHFDRIEQGVYKMKVKGSYADQIYALRTHIDYVKKSFSS